MGGSYFSFMEVFYKLDAQSCWEPQSVLLSLSAQYYSLPETPYGHTQKWCFTRPSPGGRYTRSHMHRVK